MHPTAKGKHYHVFFELLACTSDPEVATCWPSQDTLARRSHYSVRSVRNVLSDLSKWGAISHSRRFNNSNVYQVHWSLLQGADQVRAEVAKYSQQSGNSSNAIEGKSIGCIEGILTVGIEGTVLPPKDNKKEIGKDTKAEEETSAGRHNALHIWKTWNDTIASSTDQKGTPIPSSISIGGGNPAASELYRGIDSWIHANPGDWKERWQLVLDEIPANRYFKGFTNSSGRFWKPTLRSMFVASNGKDTGVERVLSGAFDSMRLLIKVDTTPLVEMKSHTKPKGFINV